MKNTLKIIFLATVAMMLFTSCSEDEEFIARTLTINETTVDIDGLVIEIVDGEARSDNYSVLFYDGIIHVFSLKEYFVELTDVDAPYTPLEDGTMYFTISDTFQAYPVKIQFIAIRR